LTILYGLTFFMAQANTKNLFIKTWGCQMNVYDSTKMADVLAPMGYQAVNEPDDADMIILNTCHIREKATDKVFSELGRLKRFKDQRAKDEIQTIMAVAGCVAQAEGDFIAERAPYVDMVFGPQSYGELPEMVAKATNAYGKNRVIVTDFNEEDKFDKLPGHTRTSEPFAFLAVQEGCDKFCTFCVVPYTRGGEYSRSVEAVLDEAKQMRDAGVREISLLGQNVNAYHGDNTDGSTASLANLISRMTEIDGIERIRYTTSHPRDMRDDLIDVHAHPKVMPYLHLPVQAGSNKILKLMNRKHERDLYFELIEKFRKVRPDIAISGDFIVGFPGETDADFDDTMDLVRRINYSSAYSFKYSQRPGTPAATMGGLIRENIKDERLQRLQALLNDQMREFNEQTVGKTVDVLFDGQTKTGQIHGRTPYNQAIHVQGNPRLIGEIIPVRLTGTNGKSVTGEIVVSDIV
jgi:tRNA-2-methylthio-N6-dimethylallyladenosine synthase